MYPLGKSQENNECSQRNTGDVPRCHSQGTLPVHLQCSRSCDHSVPIRYTEGKPFSLPKKVPVMFPSGSFAVTLQCSHQCDHSVPGLEILKEPKRCTKDVPHQYICSLLGVCLQCTACGEILGTLQAHFKCSKFCSFPGMCLQFPQNFPKSGTLQEHSQDTANVLMRNIFGTSLWFFQNFQAWYTVITLMGTLQSHCK